MEIQCICNVVVKKNRQTKKTQTSRPSPGYVMLGAMLLYTVLGHRHGIGEHRLALLWCNCLLNWRKSKRELTIYILRKQKG